MQLGKLAAVFFAAVTVITLATSAGAVDGTIEINQAKVLGAGGSFPYVISNPGSYRLTGNLTVSSTSADAIDVNASHVTIDLNGFSITGPGGSSTRAGINGTTSGNQVTVENGTITGFLFGLVIGVDGIVKSVHAAANGAGIEVGNGVIEGCTADGNTTGISAGGEAVISGNTAGSNGTGISCGHGCVVSGNTIDNNTSFGLTFQDATSGYSGNVLNLNNIGGASINNGTSLGAKNTNLCNGIAC
jgi:hypothetical protein